MTVTIKASNYQFLEKAGVSSLCIDKLKQNDIKLVIGFYDLKFVKNTGEVVGLCTLPANTNNIMKGTLAASDIQTVCSIINTAIESVDVGSSGIDLNLGTNPIVIGYGGIEGKDVGSKISSNASSPFKQAAATYDNKHVAPAIIIKSPPIPLSQANHMFQPVKGTSAGSKYFVVAMNSNLRVAARIQGGSVSIRVEPVSAFDADTISKFNSVSVTGEPNASYLSGHFECKDKVTPERIIGSVLFGAGIAFDTTITKLDLIKNHS